MPNAGPTRVAALSARPDRRRPPPPADMPVYVYRRDDGSTFELEERITANALLICPTTGRAVNRVLQPFAPRYTGSGFYSTDHRQNAGSGTQTDGSQP